MTRTKKLLFNMFTGVGRQIATVICGFVFTRVLLVTYGSSINGLVASITQFLGFISFLEMGIGPVIQSNLYEPLAEKDDKQVSRIVKSSIHFFRRIAYIFIFYVLILCIIFPKFINTEFSPLFTISLILIISISNFAQYFFGIPYQLLLNADQKSYIQVIVTTITLIINTILCIILMQLGFRIQTVKFVTAGIYLIRPVFFAIYVKKHYRIDKKITYEEEPIKQKWNGFAQHICAVVTDNTDIVILSILSTLGNVSIYNVYHLVVLGISNFVMSMANGLESFWGNIIAKKEIEKLESSFIFLEWIFHTVVSFLFITTGILIVPFVKIYTEGVLDFNYVQPLFGSILTLSYGMLCLRVPYFRIIKAAGHYKQTQIGSIIAMSLNLIISISFVYKFGLIGVAIGTLVAFTFHTIYFVFYLSHNILNRPIYHFFFHIVVDFIEVVICFSFWHFFSWPVSGYLQWILLAITVALSCFVVIIGVNILFCKKQIINVIKLIKQRIIK